MLMELKQARKILVLRFSSIGDIVLTSPVIRCLHQQTNAEIHFLTKSRFVELVRDNPYLSKVFAFEHSPVERLDELKSEGYDWVIDLHKNFRSIGLTYRLSKPSVRYDKLNVQKWLMVMCKWNVLPDKHLIDRYFDALEKHGVVSDGMGLDFFISPQAHKPEGLPPMYVAGVLGATYTTKQIPHVKWLEIISKSKWPMVLLGGMNERSLGLKLVDALGPKVINLAGTLTIQQSARVMEAAQQIIAPDTGLMHIAAALKKPLHVFWGNTIPAFGMSPYYGNQPIQSLHHEVNGLSCRPCSKLGYAVCPKGHFRCMLDQLIDPFE